MHCLQAKQPPPPLVLAACLLAQGSLPRGLTSTSGSLVLYGKPGREAGKGISDLTFLSSLKVRRCMRAHALHCAVCVQRAWMWARAAACMSVKEGGAR